MGATEFVVSHIGCADCMRLTFCQAQKVSKKAGRGKPSPATVITCGRHAVNSLRSDYRLMPPASRTVATVWLNAPDKRRDVFINTP